MEEEKRNCYFCSKEATKYMRKDEIEGEWLCESCEHKARSLQYFTVQETLRNLGK